MDHTQLIAACEESKHLINMIEIEHIVTLGHSIGLNENTRVLDLCCGYGTMLKTWSEAFGVSGVGVDLAKQHVEEGKARLINKRVKLICSDALTYRCDETYDVVVCTELSTGLFDNFPEGIAFLERFVKPGGTLVFGRLFSKIPAPPQELIDFDGPMPTLRELYDEARQCGWLITAMASSTDAAWERYIMRDGKNTVAKIRKNPNDAEWVAWTDKWYRIYFDCRRPYEGWGLFAVERVKETIQ